MKKIVTTLEWLFPVMILAFGGLLTLSTFDFPIAYSTLLGLMGRGAMSFITGLLLTGLGVLYFAAKSQSRADAQRIPLAGENVTASITVGAVQDFVRRVAVEFPVLAVTDPEVVLKKDGLRVVMHVTLRHAVNIPELAQQVCERVRVGLQTDLGISKVQSVELNVKKILAGVSPLGGNA
jgi:hypothetical protein